MFEKFCFWCNADYEIDPAKPSGLIDTCPKCASCPPVQPMVVCPTCSRSLKLPKNASARVGQKFRCSGQTVVAYDKETRQPIILKCGQLCRLDTDQNSDTGFVLEAID